VGCRGPRRPLGHRLSNSVERANPAFVPLGHLPRMGAKCSASLPRKQTRALLKTPELKRLFFFFFLLSSTHSPRSQLMISFPLSQKFKFQGIVTSAGFRSRFHFPRLWQSPISAGWSRRWSSVGRFLFRCCSLPAFFLNSGNLCRLH